MVRSESTSPISFWVAKIFSAEEGSEIDPPYSLTLDFGNRYLGQQNKPVGGRLTADCACSDAVHSLLALSFRSSLQTSHQTGVVSYHRI